MLHSSGRSVFIQILLLCIFTGSLKAQLSSRENKKLFFKADKAFDYSDYLGALKMYEVLYNVDSTNGELNYKLGVCTYEIKKYRKNSKKYFSKVNTGDFPETNYYMGKLQHLDRNYEKAIACFTQYKYLETEGDHYKKELDDLIAKCNTAMLMESNTDKTLQIKNLGNSVNTEYAEYAPLIPAEGNFLIFTSRRKNPVWTQTDPLGDQYEDIYISKRNGEEWLQPVMFDTTINTSVHDACTGLSADGERLLIYRTSKDLRSGDIYESLFGSDKWGSPKMLGSIVNDPEFLETSACYSPDGSMIFFSSNREGGFGGKDLYSVKKLPNGTWGQPFNLGSSINTPYNEDAPFVHPAANVLYFSSEGHTNMGGYDIFKSSFDEAGVFQKPENMGSPVNTVDDDIFFVLSTDASTGYLSSEREGGYGSQDIYSVYFPVNNVPLNVYNIHVFDESGAVINAVDIVLTDMVQKKIYGMYKSNTKTGKVMVISPPEASYRIAIQAEGHDPYISNVLLSQENELIFKLTKKQE